MSSPIKESQLDTMQHVDVQDREDYCGTAEQLREGLAQHLAEGKALEAIDIEPFESLFADSFQRDHRQELADAAKGRSARRRDTRRSLAKGTAAAWAQQISAFSDEAEARRDRYDEGLLFHDFLRQCTPYVWEECSGSATCLHCSAHDSMEEAEAARKRWMHVLRLGPNHSAQQTAAPYAPPIRYRDTEAGREVVEEDELLPDFQPIDFMSLKPATYAKVSRLVSSMYNWVWEEAGVSQAHPTHEYRMAPSKTAVLRECEDGRWRHDWEPTEIRFRELADRVPKMKRSYPGTHYIGRSNNQFGERDTFRILVTTIWLERHERYAVYCAWDGTKRGGRFTHWVPFEWHLVEHSAADNRALYDPELWDLDRALEVAYLKAKALRIDFGVDQPDAPLPFSPERLTAIGDAQEAGVERHRSGSGPVEE